jgi:hypothetical protein
LLQLTQIYSRLPSLPSSLRPCFSTFKTCLLSQRLNSAQRRRLPAFRQQQELMSLLSPRRRLDRHFRPAYGTHHCLHTRRHSYPSLTALCPPCLTMSCILSCSSPLLPGQSVRRYFWRQKVWARCWHRRCGLPRSALARSPMQHRYQACRSLVHQALPPRAHVAAVPSIRRLSSCSLLLRMYSVLLL